MRPPRIIIASAFALTTLFLTSLIIHRSSSPDQIATSSSPPKSGFHALLSFRAPFSLFPPNAIITLTHDNTTAFLARPAGFGPLLPHHGLKGQLWIGSGFGDALTGGELGCSDVPRWEEGLAKAVAGVKVSGNKKGVEKKSAAATKNQKSQKKALSDDGPFDEKEAKKAEESRQKATKPTAGDGTDDHLHHSVPLSTVSKASDKHTDTNGEHADIQSIQEGAEITGKVVLLSRGGCGFLEKVMWGQRRGAIAVIVGDDTKGGPLINMYGRGDTSNVSIPSIFTSYTTAHLLSSLVGPGSFLEDIIDENGRPVLQVHQSSPKRKSGGPTFTPTAGVPKATGTLRPSKKSHKKSSKTEDKPLATERPGWFRTLFLGGRSSDGSSRPPSSGQLDWVLVDEWKDDDEVRSKKILTKPTKQSKPQAAKLADPKSNAKSDSKQSAAQDDFVIGVQDWRDPDLVVPAKSQDGEKKGDAVPAKDAFKTTTTSKSSSPQATKPSSKKVAGGASQEIADALRGGSNTPGSGEYPAKEANAKPKEDTSSDTTSKGLITTIFGDDEENVDLTLPKGTSSPEHEVSEEEDGDDEYEGLWVTLTPISGASPFLDTLLVLVVSPLVTLTVVYTLLLIRSRIRRRRWRAPKSVVEQLPVRTYHTIASPGSQSPRLPSPTSSTVTTPLLQQGSSPARPRPRSRTTTGVPESALIRVNSSPLQVPILSPKLPDHEKNASHESEWRKYMGKQVECVICLEDYVEGVSRVMSLPCGHEFHADCITPWLTTRRRTCPICKGDVVRSLARGSPAGVSPRYETYHDDSESDTEEHLPSSGALPIPHEEEDLEQGTVSTSRNVVPISSSWRNLLPSSFGRDRRERAPVSQEDRNR